LNSEHDEVMLLIVTLVVPVFVTLILFEVDDRPIYVFENVKELGVEVSCAEAVTTRKALTVRNATSENTLRRRADIIDSPNFLGLTKLADTNLYRPRQREVDNNDSCMGDEWQLRPHIFPELVAIPQSVPGLVSVGGEHLTWEPSLWGRWFSAFFPPVAWVSRMKLLAHRAVSAAPRAIVRKSIRKP